MIVSQKHLYRFSCDVCSQEWSLTTCLSIIDYKCPDCEHSHYHRSISFQLTHPEHSKYEYEAYDLLKETAWTRVKIRDYLFQRYEKRSVSTLDSNQLQDLLHELKDILDKYD